MLSFNRFDHVSKPTFSEGPLGVREAVHRALGEQVLQLRHICQAETGRVMGVGPRLHVRSLLASSSSWEKASCLPSCRSGVLGLVKLACSPREEPRNLRTELSQLHSLLTITHSLAFLNTSSERRLAQVTALDSACSRSFHIISPADPRVPRH